MASKPKAFIVASHVLRQFQQGLFILRQRVWDSRESFPFFYEGDT